MTIPALVADLLPLGRHGVLLADIEATFVDADAFASSRSRRAIWQNFEAATQLLQSCVTVHAAWIGGSFTTSKLNPGDVDVLYIVSGEDRQNRTAMEQRTVDAFVNRVTDPLTHTLVPEHGIVLVDTFIMDWFPHLPPVAGDYERYATTRGYWDDWWTRCRSGGKKSPATRADGLPLRGYLEVQFSAYA